MRVGGLAGTEVRVGAHFFLGTECTTGLAQPLNEVGSERGMGTAHVA